MSPCVHKIDESRFTINLGIDYFSTAALICVATAFGHEQAVHAKNFRGESEVFRTFLFLSAITRSICVVALLAYVGFSLSWTAAAVMFIASILVGGILAGVLASVFTKILGGEGQLVMSLVS